MRTIWTWTQRVVAITLMGLVLSNVLFAATARAQMAAQPGASVVDILAALVGQDMSASTYTATTSSGTAYSASSILSCAYDLGPGANNCLCTDASGRTILGCGPGSATIYFGDAGEAQATENGTFSTTGAYICRNNCFLVNDFGSEPVKVTDANGLSINSTYGVKGILSTAVTIDVGSISAQNCIDVTATVAGVEANDTVYVTPNFDISAADVLFGNARVTNAATDQVTFRGCNVDAGGAQDPASGSYLFFVIR